MHQSIAKQILQALRFMHSLGLIHCDLKPENILIKSYSRCLVKVIDIGSSCFTTDHLCSYVQSRSYRAPEVILGLPYGPKIDIWSLGCILAELCSGQVSRRREAGGRRENGEGGVRAGGQGGKRGWGGWGQQLLH
ncbi:unnamed protein product [Closterium sp. NIES-54]